MADADQFSVGLQRGVEDPGICQCRGRKTRIGCTVRQQSPDEVVLIAAKVAILAASAEQHSIVRLHVDRPLREHTLME